MKNISIGLGLTKWQQRSIYWKIPSPPGERKISVDVIWGENMKGEEKRRKYKRKRKKGEKRKNGERKRRKWEVKE